MDEQLIDNYVHTNDRYTDSENGRVVPCPSHGGREESISSASLRVMHVIKHCGYGNGSVHVAVDLACMQSQQGYDVSFVSAGGTFEPLLTQYGVCHINLPHEQRKPLSLPLAIVKLAHSVQRLRPNIVHAHMMSSAAISYVVSRLTGVPLVTTVHNSFDRHSFLMRLGHKVVAVSCAEYEHLLQQGYKKAALCTVANAPNKSPREAFMLNERLLEVKSPCIVTVCGLHRRKGVFDLIAACSVLFRELPTWNLYIAGEGPDREQLEQQARAAGIAERVVFLGFLPAPRQLLERADIFVLASHAEPFGLSLAEARAAGCAIVATNVGGIPEVLDYGRAGRLVAPADPEQLASELRVLMTNEHVLRQLRDASLRGAEVFEVQRLVGDYGRVYEQALA